MVLDAKKDYTMQIWGGQEVFRLQLVAGSQQDLVVISMFSVYEG
jgi:hypothetical protein